MAWTTMNPVGTPQPPEPEDAARWEHTALRRRILEGRWTRDAQLRLLQKFRSDRADAIGAPDLSANPFAQIVGQLACLYDVEPTIDHESRSADAARMRLLLGEAAWPSRMQEFQKLVVGLRECLLRPTIRNGRLLLRPVTPDRVVAVAQPSRPDVPVKVSELVWRNVSGVEQWTWDVYDVSDPDAPSFEVLDADMKADLTKAAGIPPEYPFRDAEGPFLPYVLYHAEVGHKLWDPYHGRELVDGTLEASVLWTFFGHCVRNASWPQRYAVGVEIASTDRHGRDVVAADPTTVLMFAVDDQLQGGAQVGQWEAPTEPDKLLEAIQGYERRLATSAGISPSDFQRLSGDPRSGYALSISRDGKRGAAKRYEPAARAGDVALLSTIARIWNLTQQDDLATTGWSVAYHALPPSADEVAARRQHVLELLREGLITRAEARARLEGEDPETARARIADATRDAMTRTATLAP